MNRRLAVAAPSRFSSELVFRLVKGIVVIALVLLIVMVGVCAFLTYRIVTQRNDVETVTPESSFQSNYENLSFADRQGGEHQGWLLRGLRGAPVVILCHGHGSNRSEVLSLGTMLRQNYFNVYVFNFSGPKSKRLYSDLGIGETDIVLAAIENLTQQTGVNPHRVGLFGATTGGFAALAAAEQNSTVKALAVDTIYEKPSQAFEAELDRFLGGPSPFFGYLASAEFRLLTARRKAPPVGENLTKLGNVPKLFISGRDTPLLARATERLYEQAPEPKRLLVLERAQPGLASGDEKKEYENQVLSFFLHNLPLRAD